MKIPFTILMLAATIAHANPVAVADAEKTWERCVICAGETSSTVSCAVGYKINEAPVGLFSISFPVILPMGVAKDKATAIRITKPRLEIDGKVLTPDEISFADKPILNGQATRADYFFSFANPPAKIFSIVISYEQPNIDGRVVYIPQFESGTNPADYKEFSICIVPMNAGTISLESKHTQIPVSYATRVTVKPAHNEIIMARYMKPEAGDTSPSAIHSKADSSGN